LNRSPFSKRHKSFVSLFLLLVVTHSLYSQDVNTEKISSDWAAYPVLFYTSRTSAAFGAYGLRHFNYTGSPHNSTISGAAVYTLKGQMMSQLAGEFYFPGYRLKADIDYLNFPDTYYGIGNATSTQNAEEYTSERLGFDMKFQKELLSSFFIGFLYDFESHDLQNTEPGGVLDLGLLPGTRSAFNLSGLGLSINYDSRDHVVNCQRGTYLELSWSFYDHSIGSDFKYIEYFLDLRHYLQLSQKSIIAFQGTYSRISGHAPIQAYPVLGDDRLRGFSGRYMDKNLLTFQAEYRRNIFGNFGIVLFAGAGDVANHFDSFKPSEFKLGAGFGFRYTILPANKLNIRFDFGFGTHGNSSMTFLPGEAF